MLTRIELGRLVDDPTLSDNGDNGKKIKVSQKQPGKLGKAEYIQHCGCQCKPDQAADGNPDGLPRQAAQPDGLIAALQRINGDHRHRVKKTDREIPVDIHQIKQRAPRADHAQQPGADKNCQKQNEFQTSVENMKRFGMFIMHRQFPYV